MNLEMWKRIIIWEDESLLKKMSIMNDNMVDCGGTPLNNPLIDFCALLSKSKVHF